MDEDLQDRIMVPQMDWNSRFAVSLDGEDGWYPVVGWNHYLANSEYSTKPIVWDGANWFETDDAVRYKVITSKKKWKRLLNG